MASMPTAVKHLGRFLLETKAFCAVLNISHIPLSPCAFLYIFPFLPFLFCFFSFYTSLNVIFVLTLERASPPASARPLVPAALNHSFSSKCLGSVTHKGGGKLGRGPAKHGNAQERQRNQSMTSMFTAQVVSGFHFLGLPEATAVFFKNKQASLYSILSTSKGSLSYNVQDTDSLWVLLCRCSMSLSSTFFFFFVSSFTALGIEGDVKVWITQA